MTRLKGIRRCKKNSGNSRNEIIRIKESVRRDLQFLKTMIGMNPSAGDGEVVESLIKMFKQKKIGQLTAGKGFNSPLEADRLEDFYKNKEMEDELKAYESVLQEKQQTLDNFVKYLDKACELGSLDKRQIIDIVQGKQRVINRNVV